MRLEGLESLRSEDHSSLWYLVNYLVHYVEEHRPCLISDMLIGLDVSLLTLLNVEFLNDFYFSRWERLFPADILISKYLIKIIIEYKNISNWVQSDEFLDNNSIQKK